MPDALVGKEILLSELPPNRREGGEERGSSPNANRPEKDRNAQEQSKGRRWKGNAGKRGNETEDSAKEYANKGRREEREPNRKAEVKIGNCEIKMNNNLEKWKISIWMRTKMLKSGAVGG